MAHSSGTNEKQMAYYSVKKLQTLTDGSFPTRILEKLHEFD
jgi:hypothetical protein